jgi:hypothetical protein
MLIISRIFLTVLHQNFVKCKIISNFCQTCCFILQIINYKETYTSLIPAFVLYIYIYMTNIFVCLLGVFIAKRLYSVPLELHLLVSYVLNSES